MKFLELKGLRAKSSVKRGLYDRMGIGQASGLQVSVIRVSGFRASS